MPAPPCSVCGEGPERGGEDHDRHCCDDCIRTSCRVLSVLAATHLVDRHGLSWAEARVALASLADGDLRAAAQAHGERRRAAQSEIDDIARVIAAHPEVIAQIDDAERERLRGTSRPEA